MAEHTPDGFVSIDVELEDFQWKYIQDESARMGISVDQWINAALSWWLSEKEKEDER